MYQKMEPKTCARCRAHSEIGYGYARQPLTGRILCATCWERASVEGMIFCFGILALPFTLGVISGGPGALVPLLLLPAWLVLLFVLVAVHEAGHALAARLVGLRVPLVSIGLGKRLATFHAGATRVDLHLVPMSGFASVGHLDGRGLRWRRFVSVAAGPLVNLALALVAMALGLPSAVVNGNLILFGLSVLPFKAASPYGVARTDGLALWHLLRPNPVEAEELQVASFGVEAYTAYQEGRYEQAHGWAAAGLAAHPGAHVLTGMLGATLIGLGRYREAYDHYATELQRDDAAPEQRAMHQNNLAWAALMDGDPGLLPAALSASEAAHRALSWMPCVNSTRGFALIQAGGIPPGAALVHAGFSRERDPRNRATMACELAVAATRSGRPDEAAGWLAEARRLDAACPLLERAEAEQQAAAEQLAAAGFPRLSAPIVGG